MSKADAERELRREAKRDKKRDKKREKKKRKDLKNATAVAAGRRPTTPRTTTGTDARGLLPTSETPPAAMASPGKSRARLPRRAPRAPARPG